MNIKTGICKKTQLLLSFMLIALSAIFICTASTPVQAASKEIKAYKSYLKKQIKKGKMDDFTLQYGEYFFYDYNKDGKKELVYTSEIGARALYRVCTYRKGKVVLLKDYANGIFRLKNSKHIIYGGVDGYKCGNYIDYKISGGKLKKVATYSYEMSANSTKYYKNGKSISSSAFKKFSKRVVSAKVKTYKLSGLK